MEVGHEGEFRMGAVFPAEIERSHEIAELLAIEDHALKDAADEGLQGGGGEAVLGGDGGEFLGLLFPLEAGVAIADGRFTETLARLEGGDVGGDVLALVHELGIGLDEGDKLLAAHLLLAGCLIREAGDEAHDVVVINDGGGEEHELEVLLIDGAGTGFVVAFALLGFEALGGFQVGTTEAELSFLRQNFLDGGGVFLGEVGVLVELCFQPLDFFEMLGEGDAGFVALEVGHFLRGASEALGFHEDIQLLHGVLQFRDDGWGFLYEPDFPRLLAGFPTGEEGDGGIHGVLLLAEVEDIAVGLGAVEHAVGAGEGLDQAVVLELFIDINRVQVFGIEAGEQHVYDDGDIDLLRVWQVGIGPLLILDALLHVLVVEIEVGYAVIGAVAGIEVREDGFEGCLFLLRLHFVVLLFLW